MQITKFKGIPAINEIVTFITGILPTPVKVLLAIFLVTTVASFVVPAILNLFGYACVDELGSLELYQIPMNNLVQKTAIDIKRGLTEILFPDRFTLPDDPFPDGDRRFMRIHPECFVQTDYNGSTIWGYTALCTDCPATGGFLWWKDGEVCIGDGEANALSIRPDGVNICATCRPPEYYYYNHSYCTNPANQNCFFTIKNESFVDLVNEQDYGEAVYLQNILDMNGIKRTQDSGQFVNVQCQDIGKPALYLFNIEIFNRLMWIYLTVASFLIGLAFKWYSVTL